MSNLKTKYLGLELGNPLVASASPLSKELALLKQMEDAGAGAVVLHSLFEEQINRESDELDTFFWKASDVGNEAPEMFPDLTATTLGPEEYLEHIRKAKASLKIPVIASLNGVSHGGWIKYAKMMEEAGADALELNIYFLPTDLSLSGSQVEEMYTELVANIGSTVRIPLAVKLSPFFSSIPNVARLLDQEGANGLVLFNRFYQPEFDLENLEVTPTLELSRSEELNMRLHWAGILYGKVEADIAITGGIHTGTDAVKAIMAGASVACMTSALLINGPAHFKKVTAEMTEWMDKHEYESVAQMKGALSISRAPNPAAFERANYLKVLSSYAYNAAAAKAR